MLKTANPNNTTLLTNLAAASHAKDTKEEDFV
jgi:hypothetical protein